MRKTSLNWSRAICARILAHRWQGPDAMAIDRFLAPWRRSAASIGIWSGGIGVEERAALLGARTEAETVVAAPGFGRRGANLIAVKRQPPPPANGQGARDAALLTLLYMQPEFRISEALALTGATCRCRRCWVQNWGGQGSALKLPRWPRRETPSRAMWNCAPMRWMRDAPLFSCKPRAGVLTRAWPRR